jgi:hypothetical protein
MKQGIERQVGYLQRLYRHGLLNIPMEILRNWKCLMTMAVAQTLQRRVIVGQAERKQMERCVPNLIYYLSICLEKPSIASVNK